MGAQNQEAPVATNPDELPVVDVSVDDDAILGDANAPITIVEFSDFQCPYCAMFHKETLASLKAEYLDTGIVRFIYRDFPLGMHPQAKPAAMAAECARVVASNNKDEVYFKMHNWLFENQSVWSGQTDAEIQFVEAAKDFGVNIEACLANEDTKREVESDYAAGRKYGVNSTPILFVNGKKLTGAVPYDALKQVIESLR